MIHQPLAAGAAAALIATAASASTITTFQTQATFVSQVGTGLPGADFDTLASTTNAALISGSSGAFAYDIALSQTAGSLGIGVFSDAGSPGDRYLVGNALSNPQIFGIRVDFTGPVTAVGGNLFRYDSGLSQSIGGAMFVRLFDTGGTLIHTDFFTSIGRDTFRGYTSEVEIGSMVILSENTGQLAQRFAGLDNLTYGAAIIPLPPAAWAGLATLGLAGGVRAWRRRGDMAKRTP